MNTGSDLCPRKLKIPFSESEPRRSVTLDETHAQDSFTMYAACAPSHMGTIIVDVYSKC